MLREWNETSFHVSLCPDSSCCRAGPIQSRCVGPRSCPPCCSVSLRVCPRVISLDPPLLSCCPPLLCARTPPDPPTLRINPSRRRINPLSRRINPRCYSNGSLPSFVMSYSRRQREITLFLHPIARGNRSGLNNPRVRVGLPFDPWSDFLWNEELIGPLQRQYADCVLALFRTSDPGLPLPFLPLPTCSLSERPRAPLRRPSRSLPLPALPLPTLGICSHLQAMPNLHAKSFLPRRCPLLPARELHVHFM